MQNWRIVMSVESQIFIVSNDWYDYEGSYSNVIKGFLQHKDAEEFVFQCERDQFLDNAINTYLYEMQKDWETKNPSPDRPNEPTNLTRYPRWESSQKVTQEMRNEREIIKQKNKQITEEHFQDFHDSVLIHCQNLDNYMEDVRRIIQVGHPKNKYYETDDSSFVIRTIPFVC